VINAKDLQHGDVLLFDVNLRGSNLLIKTIRAITRGQFEHGAIIWNINNLPSVLEQQVVRMYSLIVFYSYTTTGETIYAFRPMFPILEQDDNMIYSQYPYGYSSIFDGLLNNIMQWITFNHWIFRPMLRVLFKSTTFDCFGLVAILLNLTTNTKWCKYPSVVQGQDFVNHPETFIPLGEVQWLM